MIELRKVFLRDGKNYILVCEDSNEICRIVSSNGMAKLSKKSKPITRDGVIELENLERRLDGQGFDDLFRSLHA